MLGNRYPPLHANDRFMTVLESIVIANFFPFTSTLILSLQYQRTSNQITTALVSFQYFVQEVGFQVFMADVSKSIPIPWTGTQQNPRVKHWDQASPYRIRKLNHENFLSCWRVQVQANFIGGLVYTGIPKTCDNGCGSMGQPFFSLPGILVNQTGCGHTRIVWYLEWCQRNGMMSNVMTVFLTFVKSMASTTSFVNIYTIDGLKLVLSPGGTQQMSIRGGSVPDFSRKRYPFRIPSIDKWYLFHIPCFELCIPFNCFKCTVY